MNVFRILLGLFTDRAESKLTQGSSGNQNRFRLRIGKLEPRISPNQIGFSALSHLPGQPAGSMAAIAAQAGIKDQVNIQLDS
jgi:hypothetical protein